MTLAHLRPAMRSLRLQQRPVRLKSARVARASPNSACRAYLSALQPSMPILRAAVDAGLKDELVFGDPEAPRFVFWEGRLRPVPGGLPVRLADASDTHTLASRRSNSLPHAC